MIDEAFCQLFEIECQTHSICLCCIFSIIEVINLYLLSITFDSLTRTMFFIVFPRHLSRQAKVWGRIFYIPSSVSSTATSDSRRVLFWSQISLMIQFSFFRKCILSSTMSVSLSVLAKKIASCSRARRGSGSLSISFILLKKTQCLISLQKIPRTASRIFLGSKLYSSSCLTLTIKSCLVFCRILKESICFSRTRMTSTQASLFHLLLSRQQLTYIHYAFSESGRNNSIDANIENVLNFMTLNQALWRYRPLHPMNIFANTFTCPWILLLAFPTQIRQRHCLLGAPGLTSINIIVRKSQLYHFLGEMKNN